MNNSFAQQLVKRLFPAIHEARLRNQSWREISSALPPQDYVWTGTLSKHYRAECAARGIVPVLAAKKGGKEGRVWKLKPCPFCGKRNIKFRFHAETKNQHKQAYGGFYCRTKDCGGAVTFHSYDGNITKAQARRLCTEKWNRRSLER